MQEIASFLEFLESVRILMLYYTCIIVIALSNVHDFMREITFDGVIIKFWLIYDGNFVLI